MIDTQRFEGLLEALDSEIDAVRYNAEPNLGNLEDIYSALYSIFEEVSLVDVDKITEEHEVLKRLLANHLSYEDKMYYRLKYDIDFGGQV